MTSALRRTVFVVLGIGAVLVLASCGTKKVTYTMPSPSMEPTFVKGDVLTITDVPSKIETGMIVLFKDPGGWLPDDQPGGTLVKRVVGVGGDRVKCCDANGRITINGTALDESGYLRPGDQPSTEPFDVQVPDGDLWLLGDNRNNSYDSRGHMGDPGGGYVPVSDVVGLVKH